MAYTLSEWPEYIPPLIQHQETPDQEVQASQRIAHDHPMAGDPPDPPIVHSRAHSTRSPTPSFPFEEPLPLSGPPTNLPSSDLANGEEGVTEGVWRLLATILANKLTYKTLLDSKDDKAQAMLDILHKVLDSWDVPEKLGHAALYATMRLCTASGVYPRCLALQDIRYEAKPVASGAFGDIWKGYYKDHPVCLKVARVYQGSDVEYLIKTYMREAIMWSHLSHPNVLPFYGIYQVDERLGSVCLVSPWMPNGNVNEYLRVHPEKSRLPLVRDILAGLEYLHKQSVVHGDLKGANILISNTGSACLADFGLSSMIDAEILRWTSLKTMTRNGGTVRWQAPELMDDPEDSSRPTLPADVYSVASVMYEVFTNQLPYHEIRNDMTVMLRVMKGLRPTKPSPGQALELSAGIWEVMERCWSHAPRERPPVGKVAGALASATPTELTLKRRYTQRSEKRQDVEADVPSALSFRAAMRGQSANFSVDEVVLLREYAKDLSQGALGASTLLQTSVAGEADANDLQSATATQKAAGTDPGMGSPTGANYSDTHNKSQEAVGLPIHPLPTPYLPLWPAQPHPIPWYTPTYTYPMDPGVPPPILSEHYRPSTPRSPVTRPLIGPPLDEPQPNNISGSPNAGAQDSRRPAFAIHPLLSGENMKLFFNISTPKFEPLKFISPTLSARLSLEELNSSFGWPTCTHVSIICDLIPQWPLHIGLIPDTSTPNFTSNIRPVAVGDILLGLYNHFRQRISHADWAQLSQEEETEVARAYTTRCKASGHEVERSNGVRRIDYAKGNVWFKGLTRVGGSSKVLELHLSRSIYISLYDCM